MWDRSRRGHGDRARGPAGDRDLGSVALSNGIRLSEVNQFRDAFEHLRPGLLAI
jgi:hypothetical protein